MIESASEASGYWIESTECYGALKMYGSHHQFINLRAKRAIKVGINIIVAMVSIDYKLLFELDLEFIIDVKEM